MKAIEIKDLLDRTLNLKIETKSRLLDFIKARCMFYKLAYYYSEDKISLYNVGLLVKRDHATVLHGLRQHDSFMLTDKSYKNLFNTFKAIVLAEKHTIETSKKYTKKSLIEQLEINRRLRKNYCSKYRYWKDKYIDLKKEHDKLLNIHLEVA